MTSVMMKTEAEFIFFIGLDRNNIYKPKDSLEVMLT